jgi:hypothetical protein
MAMQNPEHGMRMLREANVAFTASERQAIEAMTKAGDVAGAQAAILQKVETANKGMSEAMAGTTEGKLGKLQRTWESVGKAIGDALLPVVNVITDFIMPIVDGFAETMKGFMGDMKASSGGVFADITGWIKDNKDTLIAWGRAIGEIITGGLKIIGDLVGGVFGGITSAFGLSRNTAGSTFKEILNHIVIFTTGASVLLNNLDLLWQLTWSGAKMYAGKAIDFIMDSLYSLLALGEGVWDSLKAGAKAWWQNVKDIFTTGGKNQVSVGRALVDGFLEGSKDGAKRWGVGVASEFTKSATAEYDKAWNTYLRKVDAALAKRKAVAAALGGPAAVAGADQAAAAETAATTKVEFTGLSELYKKIAQSLTGGSFEGLQKAVVGNTGRTATATEKMAADISGLRNDLRGRGPAAAVAG